MICLERQRSTAKRVKTVNISGLSADDALFTIIKKLLDPPGIVRVGLNGFSDFMTDWFCDNWGADLAIRILGFKELLQRDAEFAAEVIIVLAEADVAATRHMVGSALSRSDSDNRRTPYIYLA